MSELSPAGHVYSIEPVEATHDILNLNLKHNGISNVSTFNLALSNSNVSDYTIYYSTDLACATSKIAYSKKVICFSTTLDEFTAKHNITKIDFLKIDAEGAEVDILENQNILKNTKYIILEYNIITLGADRDQKLVDLIDILKKDFKYIFFIFRDGTCKQVRSLKDILEIMIIHHTYTNEDLLCCKEIPCELLPLLRE